MRDILIAGGPAMQDGVIVTAQGPARLVIDAAGWDVLPGLIDLHGDAFERALMPRPGVMIPMDIALDEVAAGLLAAGVTTAFLAVTLSWEPGLRSETVYAALRDALRRRPADAVPALKLHVRFEAQNLASLALALADIAAGDIQMLSFNDHTPGIVAKLDDPAKAAKFVERSGVSHAAFAAAARAAVAAPEAIAQGQRRLAAAAAAAGIPVASHDDDCPATRQAFRALGAGLCEFPMTAETAREARAAGEPSIMGAPNVVRGGSHIGWHGAEALVVEKLCTVLCSDYHYPSMLQAVYRLARNFSAGFAEAVELVTKNPAEAAGLPDRGRLEAGARADIVLVAPENMPRVMVVIAGGRLAYVHPDAIGRLKGTLV